MPLMCFDISVRVNVLGRCHLSFQASYLTSVSRQGEILLQNRVIARRARIHVYKYQVTTGTYTEMRQLDIPPAHHCHDEQDPYNRSIHTYDSQDGTVAFQDCASPTRVRIINSEGKSLQEWWEQSGELITCLSNKRRVYVRLYYTLGHYNGSGVFIVDQNKRMSVLHPSPGHEWKSLNFSACEDEVSGNKAVCYAPSSSVNNTLEIFNSQGKSHSIKRCIC